jgi:hypothetical protein
VRQDQVTDSFELVKAFYVGDSGTGKTGSLISLVEAGYDLRIADCDIGVRTLRSFVQHRCPERMKQIDVVPCRDITVASNTGPKVKARAFTKLTQLLDKWDDDSEPYKWGPNTVFVLDSLTHYSRAALAFAKELQPTWKDGRLHVMLAQQMIFDQLASIMGDDFQAHVLIICHVDKPESSADPKHYVTTIGKALGPKLPSITNNMFEARTTGIGASIKRTISTVPTALLDLKNTAPFKLQSSYPLETGLAEIFAALRADTSTEKK